MIHIQVNVSAIYFSSSTAYVYVLLRSEYILTLMMLVFSLPPTRWLFHLMFVHLSVSRISQKMNFGNFFSEGCSI